MAEFGIRIMLLLAACLLPLSGEAMVRYYKFNVGVFYYLHSIMSLTHAKPKHI